MSNIIVGLLRQTCVRACVRLLGCEVHTHVHVTGHSILNLCVFGCAAKRIGVDGVRQLRTNTTVSHSGGDLCLNRIYEWDLG